MLKNKILISDDNQDIVEVLATNGCEISCDNKPMKQLVANSTNAAQEKHVPQVHVNGNMVKVDVGSVKHPMEEAHSIVWVHIVTNQGTQRKYLKPNTEPPAFPFKSFKFAVFLNPDKLISMLFAFANSITSLSEAFCKL